MIFSLTLENWKSYRDKVEFSMIASDDKLHADRILRVPEYDASILPIAAIFGGNASGKTNFNSALAAAKNMIICGTRPDQALPVSTFALDPTSANAPTKFSIELLENGKMFEYSFSATRKKIHEERLVEIDHDKESEQFSRSFQDVKFGKSAKRRQFLEFIAESTRENQLLLNNLINNNANEFRPVHDWFQNNLLVVSPESEFGCTGLNIGGQNLNLRSVAETLRSLDTGIEGVILRELPIEHLPFPRKFVEGLGEALEEGKYRIWSALGKPNRYAILKESGDLKAGELAVTHMKGDESPVTFELAEEAAGTRRLIDLGPLFAALSNKGNNLTIVIDELDRSLHPMLVERLVQTYLSEVSPSFRNQLIFTTHDLLLMKKEILRRDEMWVTERFASGSSRFFSLASYAELAEDSDMLNLYLSGNLGGVPRLCLG